MNLRKIASIMSLGQHVKNLYFLLPRYHIDPIPLSSEISTNDLELVFYDEDLGSLSVIITNT